MNKLTILIVSLLLTQSLAQDMEVLPRKNNIVSNYLKNTLNSLFDMLATKNISIPEIDLENVGRFTNVEGCVLGEMTKQVEGFKSFGFNLNMTLSKILVSGYYDIQNLNVLGLFTAFGKGNFRIAIESVSLSMCLSAEYSGSEEKFNITLPKFDILLRNSSVQFENLMDNPFVADFLNELLSNLIPDLVAVFTNPVIEFLQPVIDFCANGIITCIKKELLTGKTDECIKNLFVVTSWKTIETLFSEERVNLNSF